MLVVYSAAAAVDCVNIDMVDATTESPGMDYRHLSLYEYT
jgi:hypothetical protein